LCVPSCGDLSAHPHPSDPAGINRSATHLSLLALYALGGHLVNARLLPVGVLVTSIGFTFSLVFATQVGQAAVDGAC
jgi:ATP-binding cassette subfamily B (MDR/TAP) protein 8